MILALATREPMKRRPGSGRRRTKRESPTNRSRMLGAQGAPSLACAAVRLYARISICNRGAESRHGGRASDVELILTAEPELRAILREGRGGNPQPV